LGPDRVAGSGDENRSLGERDHAVDITHPVQMGGVCTADASRFMVPDTMP